MANELCIFCGQKPGTFRSTTLACGSTIQVACKACEKELKDLDEVEVCRRALVRGIAKILSVSERELSYLQRQRITVPSACVAAQI